MNKILRLSLILSVLISTLSYASTASLSDSFGILTVNKMTQGQFFWLKGRVGEASYTFTRQDTKTCTLNVAVAVGSISKSNLSISETKGLTIVIVNQKLNNALIQGERIKSQDWFLTTQKYNDKIDGVIINGITPKEGFILNSKRRWLSWFMGNKNNPICI